VVDGADAFEVDTMGWVVLSGYDSHCCGGVQELCLVALL